jgi:hypothetical protein
MSNLLCAAGAPPLPLGCTFPTDLPTIFQRLPTPANGVSLPTPHTPRSVGSQPTRLQPGGRQPTEATAVSLAVREHLASGQAFDPPGGATPWRLSIGSPSSIRRRITTSQRLRARSDGGSPSGYAARAWRIANTTTSAAHADRRPQPPAAEETLTMGDNHSRPWTELSPPAATAPVTTTAEKHGRPLA